MCVHFVLEGMHQHMRDRTTLHTLSSQAALGSASKGFGLPGEKWQPMQEGVWERKWRSEAGSGGKGGGGAETGHPAWNLCLLLAAAPLEQVLHCLKHTFQVCNVKILSPI